MKDESFRNKLEIMRVLEQSGIVRELTPMHDGRGGSIWSWKILKPELLPENPWLQINIIANNGIIVLCDKVKR